MGIGNAQRNRKQYAAALSAFDEAVVFLEKPGGASIHIVLSHRYW